VSFRERNMENQPEKISKPEVDVFEEFLSRPIEEKYLLRLFIAGNTPNSNRAFNKIKNICEEYLPGRYELEVIDIYEHPELMEQEQIIAIPTLVKKLPPPLQKFIGDLANTEKVLLGLDINYSRSQ
jgi:circadian clock protein KaiB